MKAMVLREFNQPLRLEEVEIPKVGKGELLVRVKACGVCASNVKYSKGNAPFIKLPHILGHEPVGEIAEVGPDVKSFSVGDRVSVYIFITCGKCLYCRRGDENNCVSCDRIGMELPGAYAEYVKVPASNVLKIPAGIPFDEACVIADAINTPFHAIRQRAKIRIGEEVVIIGIGGLGIHAVQIAKASGARVIAIDVVPHKLESAKQYGADETIDARKEDISEKVRSLTNGDGVDAYVDFVGNPDSLGAGLRSLRRGGRLVIVGNDPQQRDFQFNPHKAVTFEEIEIMGSHGATRQEMRELLQLVKAGTIKPVIAARYPLSQANEAHQALASQENPGRIVLVI
jgi:2-desacetyl-2-hydroxyethyl bacteriochlorophyllide A dehydrogenase